MVEDDITTNRYGCGYCGNIFLGKLKTSNRVTSTVKCPQCKNNVKAHEDIL